MKTEQTHVYPWMVKFQRSQMGQGHDESGPIITVSVIMTVNVETVIFAPTDNGLNHCV